MVPGTEAPENLHPYTQGSSAFVSRAIGPTHETLVSFQYERPPGDRWDIDFSWGSKRRSTPCPAPTIAVSSGKASMNWLSS